MTGLVVDLDDALKLLEDEERLRAHTGPSTGAMVEYQMRPLDFLVDVLKINRKTLEWSLNEGYDGHHWDGTPEPLLAMMDALAKWEDVGVEAGTGTQKSFTMAALILWFLGCWVSRVFTFAPKEDQLRLYIWTEMRQLWPHFVAHFPQATFTDLCIRVRGGTDDSWAAHGYAVSIRAGEQVSTRAAGMHAEHMLLVYEETPGIDKTVIEAGEHTSTSPHNLRAYIGNPDSQLDTLHVACTSPGTRHIRLSALDHPNVVTGREVVPGAVSRVTVERRRKKYGEKDRLFQSRIRGVSPSEAQDALIKLEWVRRAQARWRDAQDRRILEGNGVHALGADVANSDDGDEAAVSRWKGAVCLEVPAFPCPNSNDLGFQISLEMQEKQIEDLHVGIDSVGVGAGAVNELKRLDIFVRALNGGASPADGMDEEDFNNLRSQMAWVLREDLRLDRIAVPPDEELERDLITPTYRTKNGKILVEPKEDIKDRTPGGRSPNKGDAVMYGNFVRDRTPLVSALSARKPHPSHQQEVWKEALRSEEDEEDEQDTRGHSVYGDVIREGE